ncbi:cell division protein DivIVA [Micromonospora sp. NBC_01796]|uniref:cell division protein DivIVA n=1 Tax=Micromonospora sp. NBC_01796 TaxID=2975987 RepID=UPI002DD89CD7|nr:cell division protein DivIVA [Micromonospora sp. NBC_01796]WSA86797.1 DivIVA domain-containing protein [Micromonospora sp. NBC_01796]
MDRNAGRNGVYRGGRGRLVPGDVRGICFGWTRIGRRGYAPAEVRGFLWRVERELSALYRELAAAHDEAEHHRAALREWQSRHGRCPREVPADRRTAEGAATGDRRNQRGWPWPTR